MPVLHIAHRHFPVSLFASPIFFGTFVSDFQKESRMSEYCVYLKMPSYLRQWFIHRHGGSHPVNLIRGSIESKLLQRATVPMPEGVLPARQQEDEVAVCIPYSKSHDPRTYRSALGTLATSKNHITETGKRALLGRIKDDFDIDVWEYLHDFGKVGTQQKDLIFLFMEQRGIREDGSCWDSIAKIYHRLRKNYLTNNSRKSSRLQKRN